MVSKILKRMLMLVSFGVAMFVGYNTGYMLGWSDAAYLATARELTQKYSAWRDLKEGRADELRRNYENSLHFDLTCNRANPEEGFLRYVLNEGVISGIRACLGVNRDYPSSIRHSERRKASTIVLRTIEKSFRSLQREATGSRQ